MSNAIQFLEVMGGEPALWPAPDKVHATAARLRGVDDSQHEALLRGDREALDRLLGSKLNMMCLIMGPDDAPGRRDDDKDGDGDPGDDSPPDKD